MNYEESQALLRNGEKLERNAISEAPPPETEQEALTMEKRPYRKRFERSEDVPTHRFQEGDLTILRLVADYRFLDTNLLQILTGRGMRNLQRRLQWLFHSNFLDRPANQQDFPLTSGPMVYTLGKKGVQTLTDPNVGYDPGKIDWYTRNKRAKMFFIAHTMMVNKLRATLNLATEAIDGLDLESWQQGRILHDRAWVPEFEEELPVAPDGAFSLRVPDNKRPFRHFLLEADMGTMSISDRMYKKYRAFWRWFVDGGHKAKLGIDSFRVLTVTNSPKRRDNLLQMARGIDEQKRGSHLFLFGWEGDYNLEDPQSILTRVWRSAGDSELHSLIE